MQYPPTLSNCTLAATAILMLLLSAAGCGGNSVAGKPQTKSDSNVTSSLTVSPSTVDFGNVPVGNTSVLSVKVTNTGTGAVTISSASFSGPAFSVTGLQLPVTLGASQNLTFRVSFAPSNTGSASGSIQLQTTSGSQTIAIALTGNAAAAGTHQVGLTWNASPSALSGYNVYRSGQSSGPFVRINPVLVAGTLFSDGTVASGGTYWYVVTAVDAVGVESGYSNAAMAVVPSP